LELLAGVALAVLVEPHLLRLQDLLAQVALDM
jgi:hypothetical protein